MSAGWREKRTTRAVRDHLDQDAGGFAGLIARARRLQHLDRAVRGLLDPSLAPHVRVANVRDGRLILVTPVAAFAQRLKMEAPNLLQRLGGQVGLEGVSALEVKVAPMPPELMAAGGERET